MPEKATLERAKEDAREGKSPSTQAGEFVRQEMHHVREGKHGARSTKQAIAIGLSEARRAGVKLPPAKTGGSTTQRKAAQGGAAAGSSRKPSVKRSRATSAALKREGSRAASKSSLSRQARTTAAKRSASAKSASAKRAAKTRARTRRH
jgi:uncharacterized protein DUF6496